MKLAALSAVILLAAAFVLPAAAETYVLHNGEKIEGSILRTGNGKVTIKTKSGVSSFGVLQFSDETRDAYFPDLEPAPEPKPETATRRAKPRPTPTSKAVKNDETMPKGVTGLAITGAILCIVGSLWFIVAGFAVSVGWGIALILFNGLAGLAFLIPYSPLGSCQVTGVHLPLRMGVAHYSGSDGTIGPAEERYRRKAGRSIRRPPSR